MPNVAGQNLAVCGHRVDSPIDRGRRVKKLSRTVTADPKTTFERPEIVISAEFQR
jgi:hypothetical protein